MPILVLIRGLTGTGKSALLDHMVNRDDLNVKKLEIDEIKMKKYGTTTKCNPQVDFREAGREARELLGKGFGVVVAEAFCNAAHIDYFLSGAKMSVSDPGLLIVRLECSIETAMHRKKRQLDPQTIRQQYRRPFENMEGEMVVDSEKHCIAEIADAVTKRVNHIDRARNKERKDKDGDNYR